MIYLGIICRYSLVQCVTQMGMYSHLNRSREEKARG